MKKNVFLISQRVPVLYERSGPRLFNGFHEIHEFVNLLFLNMYFEHRFLHNLSVL